MPGHSGIPLDIGHPKTTTGPLGQGVATSVGMALAGNGWVSTSTVQASRSSINDIFALCATAV